MQDTPADWPRIAAAVFYDDAAKAIDFLSDAFGFEVRLRIEGAGGRIEHSELEFGDDGLIMVGTAVDGPEREAHGLFKSPRSLGGANTQSLCVYVDDVDAHCERARAAGAEIMIEPKTDDYGAEHGAHRSYRARDPEQHEWWFMHRLRDPSPSP